MRSKTEERRQLILDTARQAFQEIGYENCSMSEITARVGGSKATLYNYFASKEQLFAAVMLQSAGDLPQLFATLVPGDDMAGTLRGFGRRMLAVITGDAVISTIRMAQHEAGRSDAGRVFYEAGPKMGWTIIADFLADAMARGQLREADPLIATMHLRALIESEHVQQRLLGVIPAPSKKQVDAAVDRAIDVFMAGYAAAPRTP